MNYGHPPHTQTDDDVYLFRCKQDGWSQPVAAKNIGVPFCCPTCGHQVSHFIRYNPADPNDIFEVARIVGEVPRSNFGSRQSNAPQNEPEELSGFGMAVLKPEGGTIYGGSAPEASSLISGGVMTIYGSKGCSDYIKRQIDEDIAKFRAENPNGEVIWSQPVRARE